MNAYIVLAVLSVWMNILHVVTSKREPSPKLQKLQASCKTDGTCKVSIPKEELKEKLTPLQYHVTQEKGTEKPFSGKFTQSKDEGVYTCVVCGNRLFESETKFDSGSGWPSFYDVMDKEKVRLTPDTDHGVPRVEAKCGDCGSHLGHVFDDGPKPTGIRYCVNSASLDFKKETTV
ncbi:hypothetical protein KUTeg_012035 [Tegillarca granosa]|uniref:Peptide-methionine (R)-S-oxide reductase n=1 Tax=Tegillarca granosa TaxID=220873 RepID=A0ABQ9F3J1_TEGGR|nr:hypothetical protein KUTeg_012035 [Tegillarca granosa]